MNKNNFYLLLVVVLLLPLYFWGDSFAWDFSIISGHVLFPLLGMLAFSLMWLQVVVSTFPKAFNINLDRFWAVSGLWVLILFVAHPVVAVFANKSTNIFSFVADAQQVYIWLAVIAFIVFVLFEIVMRLGKKPFAARARPYIEKASYVGVILIWVHSLNIGSHTGFGFLNYVWWFYGITAVLMIGKIFMRK